MTGTILPAGGHSRRAGALTLIVSLVALAACTAGAGDASPVPSATSTVAAPSGAPPSGAPPGASGGPPGAPGSGAGATTGTAAYTVSGTHETKTGETITADGTDESAVLVGDGGSLTLTDVTVITTGDTSSSDSSSFSGLNAGVLATSGSTIAMTGGTIATSGSGANGAFATGAGATVTLQGVSIHATGGGAHGVMATQGGTMTLDDVTIETAGGSAAPVATDRGGGTITVHGGTFTSSGSNSPGLYSTGTLVVDGATFTASGAESAVIEGSNSIALTDSTLTSSQADKWGVMIYQSMSGDAEGAEGVFTMTGGSLADTATTGPLFYVTNTTGTITLKGVSLSAGSGVLLKAATGPWGTRGSNGGNATLTADGQALTGDLVADDISTLAVALTNRSTLTGAITNGSLSLDKSSTWTVTADSVLTGLSGAAISKTSISNIVGNGFTVTYDSSLTANSALGGGTFTLAGGGTLTPE